ncbi:hypothetical protein [Methylocucumis oryzae]|nr:hypothetical protein [Methylocucumis oryzae]
MDRYAAIRARNRIMSYYMPRPHEEALGNEQDPFERAKTEWLKHARQAIEDVEQFTFDDFLKIKAEHKARKPDECFECGQKYR